MTDDALARAQQRAGVQVRTLTDLSDLDDARTLFDRVWPSGDGQTQVPGNLLRAIVHAGGYASAAYAGADVVGAAFGFCGRHLADGHWHDHLHSHMAAVLEPYRDRHVGTVLKLHQRSWARERDLDTIVWTFDPLVRRNARLNLLKLGVDVEGFEVDFYGAMDDGINAGDPTDRLFAWWRLDAARTEAALRGELFPMSIGQRRADGVDAIEVSLPVDIVDLRRAHPDAAARWRQSVRRQLVEAFAAGYRIVGVTTDDGYLLERTS